MAQSVARRMTRSRGRIGQRRYSYGTITGGAVLRGVGDRCSLIDHNSPDRMPDS